MAYQVTQPTKVLRPTITPTGNQPSSGGQTKKSRSWIKGLITLVILIIIIGGGVYLLGNYFGFRGINLQADWQAVFLTNGQVYFGKIVKVDSNYVVLKDIYYLQVVNQPLQRSQEGETTTTETEQQTEQRLTLIKLGNELHGPRDEMIINRDHIILFEDLKDDSRVVQAINDYISGQQK